MTKISYARHQFPPDLNSHQGPWGFRCADDRAREDSCAFANYARKCYALELIPEHCRQQEEMTMPASFVSITPENMKWDLEWKTPWGAGSTPLAFLDGDPSKPGLYVVRVNYPPNVFTRPHWHGEDRHIVVLKGTWHMGTGDYFDPSEAVPLPVGSYAKHPAGGVHWDGAKDEEVVLQVVGIGPLTTELVWKDGPFIGPAN